MKSAVIAKSATTLAATSKASACAHLRNYRNK